MSQTNYNNPEYREPYPYTDDEITLKELILKVQEYFRELLRNWWIIMGLGIVLASLFLIRAIYTPATYTAELTFMVNEDEGGGMGGVSAILGQFGFGMGRGGGKYNLDKILELSKSMKIMELALFEKAEIEGKEDYFANHIIRLYDFHERWEEDTTGLKGFYFSHDSFPAFNKIENKVFKSIYGKIRGGDNKPGLFKSSYTVETGILELSMESISEELSIEFVEEIYNKLSKYYIEKKVQPQQQTFNTLAEKTDSVRTELSKKEYALARFKDTSLGLIPQTAKVQQDRLSREVSILTLAYGKALENLAMAEFSLSTSTPFFTAIDRPLSPIEPNSSSIIRAIIIGGILGGFLAVGFLIGRKVLRDTMQENLE